MTRDRQLDLFRGPEEPELFDPDAARVAYRPGRDEVRAELLTDRGRPTPTVGGRCGVGFGFFLIGQIFLASSLVTEPAMMTSSPGFQLTGADTRYQAVSWSESMTRSSLQGIAIKSTAAKMAKSGSAGGSIVGV